jgi:hypothetical protein
MPLVIFSSARIIHFLQRKGTSSRKYRVHVWPELTSVEYLFEEFPTPELTPLPHYRALLCSRDVCVTETVSLEYS